MLAVLLLQLLVYRKIMIESCVTCEKNLNKRQRFCEGY